MLAHDAPGHSRGRVLLADMDAVGTDGHRQVGTVVEDERDVMLGADPLHQRRPLHQLLVGELLLPELDDVHTALDAYLDEGLEVTSIVEIPRGSGGGRNGQRDGDASALAFALRFCLYWRTLASASGESMSATDR